MVYLDIFVYLGTLGYSAFGQLECALVIGDYDWTICCFFCCGVDNLNFLSAISVNTDWVILRLYL